MSLPPTVVARHDVAILEVMDCHAALAMTSQVSYIFDSFLCIPDGRCSLFL